MIIYEVRSYFELTSQTTIKYFNNIADAEEYGLAVWQHFEVVSEIKEIDCSADTVEISVSNLFKMISTN